jgi:hypothetical protein
VAVAAQRERLGLTAGAAEACAKALEAARRLDDSLEHEDDCAHFRQGQEQLLERARGLWRQLGKETGPLDSPWADAAERRRAKTAAEERRRRRLCRVGWLITGLNALLAVGLVAFLVLRPPSLRPAVFRATVENETCLFLAVSLILGVLLVALCSLGMLLSWAFFGRRWQGGAAVLFLALSPYLMSLGLLIRPN